MSALLSEIPSRYTASKTPLTSLVSISDEKNNDSVDTDFSVFQF